MLDGFQRPHGLSFAAERSAAPATIPDATSADAVSAVFGQPQREADMIMEALLREYLNSARLRRGESS
jgi:hypothetical protein